MYRALKSSGLAAGQRVAIFGVGGLGHLAIQIVKATGTVPIAVDITGEKLALATELGAAHTVMVTSASKAA